MTRISVITARDATGEVHVLCQDHHLEWCRQVQQRDLVWPHRRKTYFTTERDRIQGSKSCREEACDFLLYVVPISEMYLHFGQDLFMTGLPDLENEHERRKQVAREEQMEMLSTALQHWSKIRVFEKFASKSKSQRHDLWVFKAPVYGVPLSQYLEAKVLELCMDSPGFTDWKIETLKLDITRL